MKQFLLLSFFCVFFLKANAQLGITASTTNNQSIEWQVVTENYIVHRRADFLNFGTSGVIDYAIDLKKEAIKFRPALQLMMSNSIYKKHYFQVGVIGFEGNIEVSLSSKLNKQGKKKSFRTFLQCSPGISLVSLRYEYPKDDLNNVILVNRSKRIAPNIGAGLFFELKLSPLLSIAPTVGVRYYPHLKWKGLTESVTKGSISNTYDRTNWRQYNLGLRFGLNLK